MLVGRRTLDDVLHDGLEFKDTLVRRLLTATLTELTQ